MHALNKVSETIDSGWDNERLLLCLEVIGFNELRVNYTSLSDHVAHELAINKDFLNADHETTKAIILKAINSVSDRLKMDILGLELGTPIKMFD